MDTIFATSSGALPAAIAIIRISGPAAFDSARLLAASLPPPRTARVRVLRSPADGQILDRALVLVFDAPRTATGEDLVEFHVHGGRAVVAAVERTLERLPGLRRAEAGEFTRRALTNGVIDLTEAEGLGDLLAAETEAQRRAALRSAEGGLRRLIDDWTIVLVDIAARIEAAIDFSDEDDVGELPLGALRIEIAALADEIASVLAQPPVERLKDGLRVVLAGPPNAGKSTLLNALVGRDAAIVSAIAGTTRDRIEVPVEQNGLAYVVTDTAGLASETADTIERIGIERAQAAIASADIVLWLGDDAPDIAGALWLQPRCDLPGRENPVDDRIAVSAATGHGLKPLWERIERSASGLLPASDTLATNRRQRLELTQAAAALRGAVASADLLIVADELSVARRAFDRVTGRAGIETVLDALFAKFCLGK